MLKDLMKRVIPYLSGLLLSGILVLLSNCTPGSCFEETNAFVKATMYSTALSKAAAPDSITLYGAGLDTNMIYKKSAGVRQALMPLDASNPDCTFIIRINGVNDTIIFVYTSFIHLISKECGYTYYHTIDNPQYTRHIIDTIVVKKNTITTFNEENLRIYY
jgi:hypothetical protein